MFVSIIIIYYYLYDIIYYRQTDIRRIKNMPRKCCVYECKSNYQKSEIVCILFFRHETLRQELSRTISNVITH